MYLGKTFSKTEQDLACVHRRIEEYSASVPMHYSGKDNESVEVRPFKFVPINDKVRQHECCAKTSGVTMLSVEFSAGGVIDRHCHDEFDEIVFLVEGDAYDADSGEQLTEGHAYYIPRGQYHTIGSTGGAVMIVLFRPKLGDT
jgi:quercetin dioxygenase-like cupin family protein